ncbi:MAG: nicotinate-nucleotide adenylyltransferase [Clostridia bacterium]|nr:nicotinate-nucleotide adenylyltransferase [Clostridia bacterium]
MKIAILGGTFNPIHLGHIAMAECVLEQTDAEKICFLPNGQPPHKKGDIITDKVHRLKMVELAIANNPAFFVSTYEILQEKHCYTINTIKYFNSLDDEYSFIIGADSLFQLSRWKDADELKKICSFIVCDRANQGNTAKEVERLKNEGCRITMVNMPLVEIDSTSIRERVKNGLDISGYTTPDVIDYIKNNGLYL